MTGTDSGDSAAVLQRVRALVAEGDELRGEGDFDSLRAATAKYLAAADLCADETDLLSRAPWQYPVTSPLPEWRNSAMYLDCSDYTEVRAVRLEQADALGSSLVSLEQGPVFDIAHAHTHAHALAVCRARAGLAMAFLDPSEAVAKYGRARESFAQLDRVEGVAACSFALGLLLRENWHYELAAEEFQLAHRLYDWVYDPERAADCLFERAPCLAVAGWYTEADHRLTTASEALEAQGRWTDGLAARLLAMAQRLLGFSYDERRLCRAALCLLPTARLAFARLGNERGVADCDACAAVCHARLGHIEEARESYTNASALYGLVGAGESAWRLHRFMARDFKEQGQHSDAVAAHEQRRRLGQVLDLSDAWDGEQDALSVDETDCLRAVGRHADALQILDGIRTVEAAVGSAIAIGCMGHLDQAVADLKARMPTLESKGPGPASGVLEAEGRRLRETHRADEALVALQLARDLYAASGDCGGEIRTVMELAAILEERGDPTAAREMCELVAARATPQAAVTFETVDFYWRRGELMNLFTKAGPAAYHRHLALLRQRIGELRVAEGDVTGAAEAHRQAVATALGRRPEQGWRLRPDADSAVQRHDEAVLRANWSVAVDNALSSGALLEASDQPARGLSAYVEARALAEEVGDTCTVSVCDCRIARLMARLGDVQAARDLLADVESRRDLRQADTDLDGIAEAAEELGIELSDWRSFIDPRVLTALRLERAEARWVLGERESAASAVQAILREELVQGGADDVIRRCVGILEAWEHAR